MKHREESARWERLPEKWRWRLADLLNRLPSFCWSSLVDWVLNPAWYSLRSARRPREACLQSNPGCCYCGKRGPDSPGENPSGWAKSATSVGDGAK